MRSEPITVKGLKLRITVGKSRVNNVVPQTHDPLRIRQNEEKLRKRVIKYLK